MTSVDRQAVLGLELRNVFCDDQGRALGREFVSGGITIANVGETVRKFMGNEREVVLKSFALQVYQSGPYADEGIDSARKVLMELVKNSIERQRNRDGVQGELPGFKLVDLD